MKKNIKMQIYLDELRENYVSDDYRIDMNTIEKIIFPQFFEWDGCVLLEKGSNDALPANFSPNSLISDRTAFEANYNHVHLNDFFDESKLKPLEIFRIATMVIEVWTVVLYIKFKGINKFMLILSFDGEDVVLRFYTVRANETPWIDIAVLESFLDGVLVLEI